MIRAAKRYNTCWGEGHIAPNVLVRQFDCEQPNQKWVTDVTEFKVDDEKLYPSPMMDLFNRKIIVYQVNRRPVYNLVGDMLQEALKCMKSHSSTLIKDDNIN